VDDFSVATDTFGQVHWSAETTYEYETEVKALFLRYLPAGEKDASRQPPAGPGPAQ
jgi:hypothetical protein